MWTSNLTKFFAILIVSVFYWRLLYNEQEIPRVIEILFFMGVGISFFGADAVLDIIKIYLEKWKK